MRKLYTLTDTTVREVKAGNGATTVFNLAMEFFNEGDLLLNTVVVATGVKTLQAITTDYTVSGGAGASGTITMVVAPPTGTNLIIERNMAGTQAVDYEPNDPVPAETVEEGLDRDAMLAGQVKDVADRAIVLPIDDTGSIGDGELPVLALRKGKVLSFHATTGKPETTITSSDVTGAAASAAAAAASASAAATSETNAATSETNAATSETNAATSATNAATSETNAATSETNAATSATEAAASAALSVVNAAGFRYNFDATTAMADPGSGDIRFNHATPSSVTALALDALSADAGSPDVSAYVAVWGSSTTLLKRGTITIRKIGTPATFATYDIDAVVVDNTGWLQVPVAYVAGNGTFTAADALIVHFTRTGDKGAAGAGSFSGPGSSTDNNIIRFDGTDGTTGQDSGVSIDDDDNLFGHGAALVDDTGTTLVLTAVHNGKVIFLNNASAIALTLPETTTETLAKGFQCVLIQEGAGQVTVGIEGTDTIISKDSNKKLTGLGSVATVIKRTAGSPNVWYLGGDLAA